MPRESTIQIYRSTLVDTPTGLTFGELAYSDVNGKLFVGRTGGSSLWIGAGVTTGNISNNSTVLVPTQSAVKTYVDGVVGGGSVVNSVNNSSGAIVVTGDSGAILATVSGTNTTFGARLATTSLTGVASFNGTRFSVTNGAVDLASAYQVTGDTVVAGNAITATRSGNSVTIDNNGVRTFNGATGAVSFAVPVASSSVTGVASFGNQFVVSAAGAVSLTSNYVSSVNGLTGAVVNVALTGAANTFTTFQTIQSSNTNAYLNIISTSGIQGSVKIDPLSIIWTEEGNGYTQTLSPNNFAGSSTVNMPSSSGTLALVEGVVTRVNGATGPVTITGAGAVLFTQTGRTGSFDARLATTSLTGVASFSATNFDVTTGAVSIKSGGVPNAALVNSSFTLRDELGTTDTISLGDTLTITGGIGVDFVRTGTDAFQVRGITATTSVLGVASFNGTRFSVTDGAVDLASAFQVTGDRVSAGNAITVTRSGNSVTIDNNGVRTLNGATGAITITGAGAITYTQSGTSNTINARVASTSLTGVASFNSASFDVSAGGDVTIKTGGVSNTQLANSSIIFAGGGGSSTINLGQTLTITGTANETVVTNSAGTITVGLANNVTIPGNLTVNGTVFTANVDTFVVEDSLIALGTGNAADSLDLGWFGIYTSGATRYAGSFRDASDSGKFKFFTGLTAQPTGTIDTSAATYTVATIVANIDGGTF
jgi:hypothetical protein